MQTAPPTTANGKPGLARVLGLGSLIIYGLVLIQPTAPMPLYGEANRVANGHVVTLDALTDERFQLGESVAAARIRSSLVAAICFWSIEMSAGHAPARS